MPKKSKKKVRIVRRKAPQPEPQPVKKSRGVSYEALAESTVRPARSNKFSIPAFVPSTPPPGVLPKGAKIATDSACAPGSVAWSNAGLAGLNFMWNEGVAFMGYHYLSVLAQIPEYRLVSEVIATEMTRKWITFKVADASPDDADGSEDNPNAPGQPEPLPALLDDKKPGILTADGAKHIAADFAPPPEKPEAKPAPAEGAVDPAAAADPFDPDAPDPNGPSPEDDAAAQLANEKAAKVKELEKEFERLNVREVFRKIAEQDGFMGRAHIYIDTGEDDKELKMPMGDGNELTISKYAGQAGFIKALRVVEPVWAYPSKYNAVNPLAPDWYRPESWFVMSKEIHRSRFLTFIGREVPDLMKAQFSFGGLSLTQMIKPYVDNWLETRQSVNDLIQAFSTMVLSTDMQDVLGGGPASGLMTRVDMFNNMRNNRGTFVINKESEEMTNIAVPLGTLDHLQAQAQEHIASVARIPLVKLTGISPTGLNASSEGEIRVFYDTIHAYQEKFFTPHLTTIFRLIQISLWGEVDEDITFDYLPLWELDEAALATMRKTEADTHGIYMDKGVVDPLEVRKAIAGQEDSPYDGLDPNDLPAPPPPPVINAPPGGGGGPDAPGGPDLPPVNASGPTE